MAADGNGDLTRRSVFQLTGAAFALPAFQSSYLENGPMPFTPKFVDLVRNVTTVTGTGPVTLGAVVSGYSSLADAVAAGEQFYYCIQGVDKPAEREVGRGTMQADGKIARQPIAGTPTSFTGGTKTIALVAAAEWFSKLDQLGSGAINASSRTELAANASTGPSGAYLSEIGREGNFGFDASNLTPKVAADSQRGIYVAPASDPTGASGAWVRKFDGPVNPLWFGVVEGDAGGANGAGNSAALAAMFAALRGRAKNVITNYQGLDGVRFPPGHFEFASTIEISDGTLTIEGSESGFPAGHGTVLKFPAGVTGIRTQRYNTSGATATDGVTHRGGDGAVIRNLALRGGYTTTEAEAHGIQLRSRAHVENVYIEDFEGDGICCHATAGSGSNEGNANNSRLIGCRIQRCRRGLFLEGADSNIWTVIALDASSNRQWGIEDSSFLGNSYFGCHASGNGLVNGAPPSVVSHGGNRYYCIAGQEAGASTNPPSGTTADNNWWGFQEAGGASTSNNIPAWTSGTAYRAGGSYRTDNPNARNLFVGCYVEGGQGRAQLVSPTLVVGGMLAGEKVFGSLWSDGNGITAKGYRTQRTDLSDGSIFTTGIGEANLDTALYIQDTVAAPSVYRLRISGFDLRFDYQNSSSLAAFHITGPFTTQQFGTGAAVPHAFAPAKLMVGDTVANSRLISNGTAAPASGAHGQGEVFFARTPTLAGVADWRCSAAGTPGTWIANYAYPRNDPTTGIGYVAGAGGAATQATSKSTGVTLNKVAGQITMNAAALAADASVSFILTNSVIAASDVLIVNIGAGATADAYMVTVDQVAAGSARIQLRNVSASPLSEALVLNFAVIKAVAA